MSDNLVKRIDEDYDRFSTEVNEETFEAKISSAKVTEEELRRRTFSDYPHPPEFTERMIDARLYYCNVNDRVICLECGCVYEHWKPGIDDPCEVHMLTSPECKCVQSNLRDPRTLLPPRSNYVNLSATTNVARPSSVRAVRNKSSPIVEIVPESSPNSEYAKVTTRKQSFDHCPKNDLPPIDDLVQAGFFFTGTENVVTCFYCDGSLRDWGAHDNPKVEHLRWFPECAYACQLCGPELYEKTEASKRLRQEWFIANKRKKCNSLESTSSTTDLIIDHLTGTSTKKKLMQLIEARLRLPISQKLSEKFPWAIIRQCWNDQLKLNEEDFVSEQDLCIACEILQKQNESIGSNGENIIIPSTAVQQIKETLSRESDDLRTLHRMATVTETGDLRDNCELSKICLQCHTEERKFACIPCGHFSACDTCHDALKSCPVCQGEIETFARIYLS